MHGKISLANLKQRIDAEGQGKGKSGQISKEYLSGYDLMWKDPGIIDSF